MRNQPLELLSYFATDILLHFDSYNARKPLDDKMGNKVKLDTWHGCL